MQINICFSFVVFALQPPLVQAVFYGDADEVRALLYKKEDVNSTVSPSDRRFKNHMLLQ